jgi:hypothetical protein
LIFAIAISSQGIHNARKVFRAFVEPIHIISVPRGWTG